MLAVSALDPIVATMPTSPGANAVTSPEALTVAIVLLMDIQAMVADRGTPAWSTTCAENRRVSPTPNESSFW